MMNKCRVMVARTHASVVFYCCGCVSGMIPFSWMFLITPDFSVLLALGAVSFYLMVLGYTTNCKLLSGMSTEKEVMRRCALFSSFNLCVCSFSGLLEGSVLTLSVFRMRHFVNLQLIYRSLCASCRWLTMILSVGWSSTQRSL